MKNKVTFKQIMAVVIVIAMMPFASVTADADVVIDPHDDGYYYISSPEELLAFANKVNVDLEVGACAKLTADIDLSSVSSWAPIGKSNTEYNGNFDGCGHKIYNLNIEKDSDFIGLFGYIDGGKVNDLTIASGSVKGNIAVGGIVGHIENGSIKNCNNNAVIEGRKNVGGIVGSSAGTVIENCNNTADIKLSDKSGEIPSSFGGITGASDGDSSINDCKNSGEVGGSGVNHVGGIAGNNDSSTVSGCKNTAEIYGRTEIGGIVGTNVGEINRCENKGKVSGTSYLVGGIAGDNEGKIEYSDNRGDVATTDNTAGGIAGTNNGEICFCYNTGNITVIKEEAGGIVGSTASYPGCKILNCYNTGEIRAKSRAGGIAGRVSASGGIIEQCYNTGDVNDSDLEAGGIAGGIEGSVQIKSCFYNSDTCTADTGVGDGDSSGTKALKTAQMTSSTAAQNMVGFSEDEWLFRAADDMYSYYPHIKGFNFDENGDPLEADEVNTADWRAKIINDGVYKISNYEELKYFGDHASSQINGVLLCDIECTDSSGNYVKDWKPTVLRGVFDGDGYVIKGLSTPDSYTSNAGFADELYGTVRNVGLVGGSITGSRAGGIAAKSFGGKVQNCYNTSDITATERAGGIIGESLSSEFTVTDCYNEGKIYSSGSNAGGIIGQSSNINLIQNCRNSGAVESKAENTGGIVGLSMQGGTIDGCTNEGPVTGHNNTGGIVGFTQITAVTNCYNKGSVYNDEGYTGGIVGNNRGSLEKCRNEGDVCGKKRGVGGIAGYSSKVIEQCINKGSVSYTGKLGIEPTGGIVGFCEEKVKNCRNEGEVNGNNSVGGICGYTTSTVTDCYTEGDKKITGKRKVGGIAGYIKGTIKNCSNNAEVSGDVDIGGIAGEVEGNIDTCDNCTAVSGGDTTGGIAGYLQGKITNCQNSASVTGTSSAIGGIVGNGRGEITDCINAEAVKGSFSVGGIAGYLQGKITNCQNSASVTGTGGMIGGIVGIMVGGENSKIIKCCNTAKIISKEADKAGGIAGDFEGGAIKNCYNSGDVESNGGVGGIAGETNGSADTAVIENCFNSGDISGENAGGIAGCNDLTVQYCYNTGKVGGTSGLGGIVGWNKKAVKNCYNTGEVEGLLHSYDIGGVAGINQKNATVKSCYNTARIDGVNRVGGVIGNNYYGTVTDCYSTGDVTGTSIVGGIIGLTEGGEIRNCYYDKKTCSAASILGKESQSDVKNVERRTTTEMTGSQALSDNMMIMSNSSVWLVKQDGGDDGNYYFYYPHLKGFDFEKDDKRVEFPTEVDDGCTQIEANGITDAYWPAKAVVNITWTGSNDVTYNGQDQTMKPTEISVGGNTLTENTDYVISYYYQKNKDAEWVSVTEAKNAGKYTSAISYKTAHNAYVRIFNINQKQVTITAGSATKYEDGKPLTVNTYKTEGLLSTDSVYSVVIEGSQTQVGTSDNVPKDAVIKTAGGEDVTDNYNIKYEKGTLEVLAVTPLTITAKSASKEYDGTPLTKDEYDVSGLLEGHSVESVDIKGSQTVCGSSDNVISNAKIVNGIGEDVTSSYNITYQNGKLEITKKAVTITADSDAKVYDGKALTKNSYTNTPLAEADSIESVTLTGSQTVVGSSENVPSAAKIVNGSGEDVTSSYNITYQNGTLEITKKAVTITADSDAKVYDGKELTKDSYTNTALAEGDSIESVTLTGSQTVVGSSENVPGEAKIVNGDGDDVTSSYNITYQNGTLEITKKAVTITADSDAKEYDGKALTKDSYTNTPLAEGDKITSVTVTGSQTDKGSGDNTVSEAKMENAAGEDVTGCYDITYVNGTLQVTAAKVTIKADDKTKVYGEKDPELTFTVSGLADEKDIEKISFEITRDAGENKGEYAITPSGVASQGNYDVVFESGKLTVTKAKATVKAEDKTKVYGEDDPAFTAAVSGLVNGDKEDVIKYTLTRAEGENVGEYAIIPSGDAEQDNYDVVFESGKITVTKAKATVKAEDKTKVYGEDDPEFTATVSGLVNGDKEDVIKYTLTRAEGENVGEYAITPSGEAEQGNYDVVFESGKLTVTKVKATVAVTLTETEKPKAKELTEDGMDQPLLEAPAHVPEGYKIRYSTDGGETWSDEIPTAKEAGVYVIKTRYIGDENHDDFDGETVTVVIKAVYTVIWYDGDGSELDRKTYAEGEEEPITDKTPAKAEDEGNTYKFKGWDIGKTDGKIKRYEPEFTAEPKEVIVPKTGDSPVIGWALIACAALMGMIFIPICGKKRAGYR
ncbi:MAG: hypothetical protein IJT49_05665 [Clostridia bacterium]|nr:hypothetical protein [Clostridia bacterium]